MKFRMVLVCLLIVPMLSGCAGTVSPKPAGAHAPTSVAWADGALVYRGWLQDEANRQASALLKEHPETRRLDIESNGGELNMGMDLAEIVLAHGLDVRVIGKGCASSCANYVFPAGKLKTIAPGAVILWHGSAIQDLNKAAEEGVDFSAYEQQLGRQLSAEEKSKFLAEFAKGENLAQDKARQSALYKRLGVDERITVFGQEVGCECAWTMSVADMAAFGLQNVQAPSDYGTPQPWWQHLELKLLSLSDYPQYRAALGRR